MLVFQSLCYSSSVIGYPWLPMATRPQTARDCTDIQSLGNLRIYFGLGVLEKCKRLVGPLF